VRFLGGDFMNVKKVIEKAEALRESFVSQLQRHGADIDLFVCLIDDYIALFEISENLKADIAEQGEIIREKNSAGCEVRKINPSIKELRDTNKSMLAILKQLDLSISNVILEDDEEL
jgi:phage terminase small subunit